MTTPKATFAGLAFIAALCAGFTLGLTAPAWAGLDEGVAALQRGDYETAIREFRPLAIQGHAEAQYNLGKMYFDGKGLPGNLATAFQWYRKAAEQGYAKAQGLLGVMYYQGLGVPQDYLQAHMWFNLSASRSPLDETFETAVKGRDEVASKMSPAQIFEAQKLAREWRPM